MSAERPAGRKVPVSYRVHRLAVVAIFLVALLVVGLGAAGHGPAAALAGLRRTAVTWVKHPTFGHPASATQTPTPAPTKAHKHHRRRKHRHHKHRGGTR